ncbi:stage III sporulation protein AF [Caloranaerobacter ferrireducens]|uniref:stage III sporulation protein AF n=1 Tax=Caloranaerobacter ferrireducens TaxID=1323370 RepID=UPI00084D8EBA|nr:stage III sporulation protein AF [Caloranaerobacter ferrireducens]
MISLLRQWSITIVTLVVLITFLEIILPKSDLKKYINITTGFLLIITILNPFIKLLSSDINIEKEVFKNIMLNSEKNFYINDDYRRNQENQTIKLYKDKIKRHIKKTIEDNFRYKVIEINIDVEKKETENFGKIKKINLVLSQEYTALENKNTYDKCSINIEPVEEIEVNLKSIETEKIENSERIDSKVDEIKTLISNNYKLPKESISIIYQ